MVSRDFQRTHYWTPKIQDGGVMLKIVKSPYLNKKSSDFDEIWYKTANLVLDDSQMNKYENFQKKSRWRTAAILIIVF